MNSSIKKRATLFVVSGLLLLPSISGLSVKAGEKARRADDFVNSMGIGYHVGDNAKLVATNLAALGIRYTRSDGNNRNSQWDYWNRLYTQHGIKINVVFRPDSSSTNWAISNMVSLVDKYPAMVAGVEGPNETDGFGISYKNTNFPQATITFQNDLYNAMKADPVARKLPVLAPSLGKADNTSKLAGCQLDYENIHSYAGGKLPRNGLDSFFIHHADKIITPCKPIIASECGWHTSVNNTNKNNDHPGVSERAQGNYYPRLFGEYWNRGIVRTYTYELVDGGKNPLYSEHRFGIVHVNGTPKPAFTAEKNMIAVLADPGESFTPGLLNYSLSGATNNVHHTLLQKRSNTFYLLLWQDVLCFDVKNKVDITNSAVAVTLHISTNINAATVYNYDDLGNLMPKVATIVSNSLSLSVPDSVLFVKLSSNLK